MNDVTDATFATAVVERSNTVPVVVDLWAEWCGPCKTLGPILETVIAETGGKVELAKVDVDSNPQTAQAFQVQGIPAVYALKDGQVVDSFVGAQGEPHVRAFVDRLMPTDQDQILDGLLAKGDEASLREILAAHPDHPEAIPRLAQLLVDASRGEEALELLERIPETPQSRQIAAAARTGKLGQDDILNRLDDLLTRVKDDENVRQQFIDLLDLLGAEHPQTGEYRRRLSSALF
jgi:putative thioredoxin